MPFTQIMTVDGADEQALHEHVASWDADQSGVAPGYLGARVLADQDRPGRHLIEVDFSSAEEARQNDQRPETAAWAKELRHLVGRRPAYRNLRQVYATDQRP